MVRYFDAQGNPLKIRPGSAFESHTAFMSYSGANYLIPVETRTTIEMENVHIPDDAVDAEVIATKVDSVKAGTIGAWFRQPRWSEWPKKTKAPSESP